MVFESSLPGQRIRVTEADGTQFAERLGLGGPTEQRALGAVEPAIPDHPEARRKAPRVQRIQHLHIKKMTVRKMTVQRATGLTPPKPKQTIVGAFIEGLGEGLGSGGRSLPTD